MSSVVVVLGPAVEDEEEGSARGVASVLGGLGARVRAGGLFAEVDDVLEEGDDPQCIVVDGELRPDLAGRALRSARKVAALERTPSIVTLPARWLQNFDPSSGFDDFIVLPCTPAELYARIRAARVAARASSRPRSALKIGAHRDRSRARTR